MLLYPRKNKCVHANVRLSHVTTHPQVLQAGFRSALAVKSLGSQCLILTICIGSVHTKKKASESAGKKSSFYVFRSTPSLSSMTVVYLFNIRPATDLQETHHFGMFSLPVPSYEPVSSRTVLIKHAPLHDIFYLRIARSTVFVKYFPCFAYAFMNHM